MASLLRPQLLKNALQRAVEKGQLEQITGKGASGTFQVGEGRAVLPPRSGNRRPWGVAGPGRHRQPPPAPSSGVPTPYSSLTQLKKSGEKPLLGGSPMEDAILSAIAAMNEPKTCSTTALKKYVLEKHPGTNSSLQGRAGTGCQFPWGGTPRVAF